MTQDLSLNPPPDLHTIFILSPPDHHSSSTSSAAQPSQLQSSPRRKKKRVYTSCRQCRKRRCGCSRELPCKMCVSRGEGDQCDWTGATPQVILEDAQKQSMSSFRPENPEQFRMKEDFRDLHTRVDSLLEKLKHHQQHGSAAVGVGVPEIVPVANYHVEDVATQLSRFTLNQAVAHLPVELPQTNPKSRISLKEVEEYVEEEERRGESEYTFQIGVGGSGSSASPSTVALDSPSSSARPMLVSSAATAPLIEGLLGIGKGPSSFEGIMAQLPSVRQIKTCLEQFEIHRAWMHRIYHRPTFWEQAYRQIRDGFTYTDQQAQLHWLAILFSVCGLGLFNNVLQQKDCPRFELPTTVRAQRDLALRWCRAASSCLELGRYETEPSLDSISAMAILAQLPLYTSNGETLGIALDFIGKAIDLAMRLDLHIDPDSHPAHKDATALAKQNRRRLMIALLCQHYKMGGLLCQNWGLRPLKFFEGLQMPRDQFDEDYDSADGRLKIPREPGSCHTIMTGVRCRFQVSRIWQEIGIMFADPAQPPVHEKVLRLDEALRRVESEWPQLIRTQFDPFTCAFTPPFTLQLACLPAHQVLVIDRLGCFAVFAAAMVRLHRGFLMETDGVPSEDIKMHRQRVYHYGRSMLAIHRTKLFPLDNVPLQFFVMSSTISLAVYCLTADSRNEEDECEMVVKELEKVVSVLKRCTGMSSILRRTYAVLNFALRKLELSTHRTISSEPRSAKRTRVDGSSRTDQTIVNELVTREPATNPTQAMVSNDPSSFSLAASENAASIVPPQNGENPNRQSMESLLRFLTQALPLQEKTEFNHLKQKQSAGREPAAGTVTPEIAQMFDFSTLFSFGSTHQPNSSGSINYLSSPPSSTSFTFSSQLTDQELTSSPASLSYSMPLSFGANDNPFGSVAQPSTLHLSSTQTTDYGFEATGSFPRPA